MDDEYTGMNIAREALEALLTVENDGIGKQGKGMGIDEYVSCILALRFLFFAYR
jgi:hypothetical protein